MLGGNLNDSAEGGNQHCVDVGDVLNSRMREERSLSSLCVIKQL